MPEKNAVGKTFDPPKWMGVLYLLTGAAICLLAVDVIPSPESSFHAPRSVLFLAGLVFLSCSGVVFTYGNQRALHGFIAIMTGCLGAIGLWVAVFGNAENFSSNVPIDSPIFQVSLGRIFFAIGGTLCCVLSLVLAARALWPRR
jgi:hypothetical protein